MSSTFSPVQCSINPNQNPIIGRSLSITRHNICSKLYTTWFSCRWWLLLAPGHRGHEAGGKDAEDEVWPKLLGSCLPYVALWQSPVASSSSSSSIWLEGACQAHVSLKVLQNKMCLLISHQGSLLVPKIKVFFYKTQYLGFDVFVTMRFDFFLFLKRLYNKA